jgi:hypothetical protein
MTDKGINPGQAQTFIARERPAPQGDWVVVADDGIDAIAVEVGLTESQAIELARRLEECLETKKAGTLVDMPKVTQMLDSGWLVTLYKNELGSYTAEANRKGSKDIITDDFTPEQALTRLAYKVFGEII